MTCQGCDRIAKALGYPGEGRDTSLLVGEIQSMRTRHATRIAALESALADALDLVDRVARSGGMTITSESRLFDLRKLLTEEVQS